MAIYHLAAQVISRSQGRSIVAAAAYRAGGNLYDSRLGIAHDYFRKGGVAYSEILAPAQVPYWVFNREALWNQVDSVERRKDSQLAREFNVALPIELTFSEQVDLLRGFVLEQYVGRGMIADFSIHTDNPQNPHAHLLVTMRTITAEGFGLKERDWNHKDILNAQREAWANHVNYALEQAGHSERVDHRSLLEQGIDDRLPQIHLGPTVTAMKDKAEALGIYFDHPRLERYQEIEEFNAKVQRLKQEIAADTQRLEALVASLTAPMEEPTSTAEHAEEAEEQHEGEPAAQQEEEPEEHEEEVEEQYEGEAEEHEEEAAKSEPPPAKLEPLEPSEQLDQEAQTEPTTGALPGAQSTGYASNRQAELGADPPDAGATIEGESVELPAELRPTKPPEGEERAEPHEGAESPKPPDQEVQTEPTTTVLPGGITTDYDSAQLAELGAARPLPVESDQGEDAVPIAELATEQLRESEPQEPPELLDQEALIERTTTAFFGEQPTSSTLDHQVEPEADSLDDEATIKGENPPPVESLSRPPSQPDENKKNADPSPGRPTSAARNTETIQPIEPEPDNAQRWQDLSQDVLKALPQRSSESITNAVAAIAMRRWGVETAAAILAESEIGKALLEEGETVFQQWCDRHIEKAKLVVQRSSVSTTEPEAKPLDQTDQIAPKDSTTPPQASKQITEQDHNQAPSTASPVASTPGEGTQAPLTDGGAIMIGRLTDKEEEKPAPSREEITPEAREAEIKRKEAEQYYAEQWQQLSQNIQNALQDITPERLTIAVAAVAINKWDGETAAAILSQSEAGKAKQAQGKEVFKQWLKSQLEEAQRVVDKQQPPPTQKDRSQGR